MNNLYMLIDIGTSKIVCFITIVDTLNYNLKIIGYAENKSHGFVRGIVKNITDFKNSLSETIKKAKESIDKKTLNPKKIEQYLTKGYIAIGGSNFTVNSETLNIDLSKHNNILTKEILRENIYNEKLNITENENTNEKIINFYIKNILIDDEPIENPYGSYGKNATIDFFVLKINTNYYNLLNNIFNDVGLTNFKLVPKIIASSEALLTSDDKTNGIMLIDIGSSNTDSIIYKNNYIKSLSFLPFAGNIITQDIKNVFKISERIAEQIKIKFGKAYMLNSDPIDLIICEDNYNEDNKKIEIDSSLLTQVIMSRVKEILLFTKQNLIKKLNLSENEVTQYFNKNLFNGILLTGLSASLERIDILTQEIFKCPVSQRLPNINLVNFAENIKIHQNTFNSHSYSTIIGLLKILLKKIQNNPTTKDNKKTILFNDLKKIFFNFKKVKTFKENLKDNIKNIRNIFTEEDSNF